MQNRKSGDAKVYPILAFIFVLSYFYPTIYRNVWINYFRYFCFGLEICLLFIENIPRLKIKRLYKTDTLIFLFYFLLFVISAFYGLNYGTFDEFMNVMAFVSLLFFLNVCIYKNERTFRALFLVFMVLVIWDAMGIVLNPNGLFQIDYSTTDVNTSQWIFGNKNTHTAMFMLLALYAFYYEKVNRRKSARVLTIACLSILILSAFILGSSTTIIITILLFLGYILHYSDIVAQKTSNLITYIVPAYFVLNLLVVLGNTFFLSNLAQLFGKTATLSGRTGLWERSIIAILKHPFLGYGKIDSNVTYNLLNSINPHNALLGCMLYGGIILTVIYVLLIIDVKNSIKKTNEKVRFLFFVVFMCVLIRAIVEQTATNYDTMFLLYSMTHICNSKLFRGM